MQYKKIEIHGKNLSDFDSKRNPLMVTIHALTTNERTAITFVVKEWMRKDEYKWLLSSDEATELLHKLDRYIGYEQI